MTYKGYTWTFYSKLVKASIKEMDNILKHEQSLNLETLTNLEEQLKKMSTAIEKVTITKVLLLAELLKCYGKARCKANYVLIVLCLHIQFSYKILVIYLCTVVYGLGPRLEGNLHHDLCTLADKRS